MNSNIAQSSGKSAAPLPTFGGDTSCSPPRMGYTSMSITSLLLGDSDGPPSQKIAFRDTSTPQPLRETSPVKGTPPVQRLRNEESVEFERPIEVALKGLSQTQLIDMIKTITSRHPDVEDEIRKEMPMPDLTSLAERLNYLKSNIIKGLPSSRLSSKTNTPAYSRVLTHLITFKKCLVEQGKVLVESQHWESVIQYVFLAWRYVRATPVWDHQAHNAHRKQCFRALLNFCLIALMMGSREKELLIDVQEKLQGLIPDSEEVYSCLKQVQCLLQYY